MEFAIPGFIKKFCTPNALLTLAEYLEDYASEKTREEGRILIGKEMEQIEEGPWKEKIKERLKKIAEGERDLRL